MKIFSTSPNQHKVKLSHLMILLLVIFFLSGCAETITLTEPLGKDPVGFWKGLLHGFILPFSFIISLFDSDVAVYAIYNNGGWYNFGFVLGASIIFGGSGKASKRK